MYTIGQNFKHQMLPASAWDLERLARTPLGPMTSLLPYFSEQDDWPDIEVLNEAWQRHQEVTQQYSPLHFALQQKLGKRRRRKMNQSFLDFRDEWLSYRYEYQIVCRGCVPTRNRNVHDFFNALTWMLFPKTKTVLYRKLYTSSLDSVANATGPIRNRSSDQDVMTCFDEGSILVLTTRQDLQRVQQLLGSRDRQDKRQTPLPEDCRLFAFGHGLHEVCYTQPEAEVLALTVPLLCDEAPIQLLQNPRALDLLLAEDLEQRDFSGPQTGWGTLSSWRL